MSDGGLLEMLFGGESGSSQRRARYRLSALLHKSPLPAWYLIVISKLNNRRISLTLKQFEKAHKKELRIYTKTNYKCNNLHYVM